MTTLFISDLHLHESRPEVTEAFQEFLRTQAQDAQALYILGDFFDVWIGDDDDSPLATQTAAQLRQVADKGVAIYLMHGNRDFLLGEQFAKNAGAQLIDDRSEEHTSELQSRGHLVCRLLLEKKKENEDCKRDVSM